MLSESERLAHVFLWRQATPPDVDYARQVLSIANPAALLALGEERPPLHLFTVQGNWPADADLWTMALADMRRVPLPTGEPGDWINPTRFDLAGWQGTDSRTGEGLFVVTAYRRANAPDTGAFHGGPAPAPPTVTPRPVAQIPYQPQRPTGPLGWPGAQQSAPQREGTSESPATESTSNTPSTQSAAGTTPAEQPPAAVPEGEMAAQTAWPMAEMVYSAYGPSDPPPGAGVISGTLLGVPESYAPFYAGFGRRLTAALIDFLVMSLFQAVTVGLYFVFASGASPHDFGEWVVTFAPFACMALAIFAAYHVVQWSVWGQTLGKSLMGIRVVDAQGNTPSFGRSLLRILGYFFSLSIGGIGGFLLIVFDPRGQALHDKIAETYVVPEKPALTPPRGLPGYPDYEGGVALAATLPVAPATTVTGPATTVSMANVVGQRNFDVVQLRQGAVEGLPRGQEGEGDLGYRPISSLDEQMRSGANLSTLEAAISSSSTAGTNNGQETVPYLSTGQLRGDQIAGGTTTRTGPTNATSSTGSLPGRRDRGADRVPAADKARDLFRQGIEQMELGVRQSARGYKVEPSFARNAAQIFKDAVELVPTSVVYRYFYAVSLRYAEGFEVAIREFRRVLDLDPNHYEARQQVAYGPRWHDAYAYPPWTSPAPIDTGALMPESILALLPQGTDPVTRLVLLREGSVKVAAVLSRTPRSAWAQPLSADLPARIRIVLSRTPSGPIIAFYVVVEDRPDDPYKGETFLNPHDPGQPAFDACQLGQNILAQMARQDRTYLIFVDEDNRLLLSRKLLFDAQTQVNIARCRYEAQTLPVQLMDAQRFQQAARWHMEHFSLDQIK